MRLLVGDDHSGKKLHLTKRTTVCNNRNKSLALGVSVCKQSFSQKKIARHLTESKITLCDRRF